MQFSSFLVILWLVFIFVVVNECLFNLNDDSWGGGS